MDTARELRTHEGYVDDETRDFKRPRSVLHRSTLTLGPEGLARYVANRATTNVHHRDPLPSSQ